jgi:hypothetical protein
MGTNVGSNSVRDLATILEENFMGLDYGTAVVLLRKFFPPNFWQNMTTDQKVMVYTAALKAGCEDLTNMMFQELSHTEAEFEVWQAMYNSLDFDSGLLALAKTRMVEKAANDKQWEALYLLSPIGTDTKQLAHDKVLTHHGKKAASQGY